MPIVETTLIAGYAPQVKQRLATALTRGVLSVMNAAPEAVIVVFREVEPENWVRGGVSRAPGPPLPAALDTVRAYLAAHTAGDADALAALFAEGCPVTPLPAGMVLDRFDEAFTDKGSLVFAQGQGADGAGVVLVRFHVVAGAIADIALWRAAP
jgi:phenylpyruvate tautomerase PptA (4-oxalocrotonate tautomerase family)